MNEFDARAILGVDHDALYGEIKKSYEFLSDVISGGFQNQDTLSLVRDNEALTRINEAWEHIESLHWLGVLGQSRDGWNSESDWTLSDGQRVAGAFECEICGAYPASSIHIGAATSRVYRLKRISHRGSFCRTCGTTISRTLITKMLIKGWWGPGIVFVPYFIAINLLAISRLKKLGNPISRDQDVLAPYEVSLSVVPNPFLNGKAFASSGLAVALVFASLQQFEAAPASPSTSLQVIGGTSYDVKIAKSAQEQFPKPVEAKNSLARVNYIIDPKVDADYLVNLKANVNDFTSLFAEDFADYPINLVVFKSSSWGLKKLKEFKSSSGPYYISSLEEDFSKTGYFTLPCNGPWILGMSYSDHFGSPVLAISEKCGWNSAAGDAENQEITATTVNHELTHGLQSIWTKGESCLPAWFDEGEPSFVGAVTSKLGGDSTYAANVNYWRYGHVNHGNLAELETKNAWDIAKNIDSSVYNQGALAVQYLVATHGWKKVKELIVKSADPYCDYGHFTKFKRVFKNIMGTALNSFYQEVAPFLNPPLLSRLNANNKIGWWNLNPGDANSPGLLGIYETKSKEIFCEIGEFTNVQNAVDYGSQEEINFPSETVWYTKDSVGNHGVVLVTNSKSSSCAKSALKVLKWKN